MPRLIRKRIASAPALAPARAPAGASLTDQVIALGCSWTSMAAGLPEACVASVMSAWAMAGRGL